MPGSCIYKLINGVEHAWSDVNGHWYRSRVTWDSYDLLGEFEIVDNPEYVIPSDKLLDALACELAHMFIKMEDGKPFTRPLWLSPQLFNRCAAAFYSNRGKYEWEVHAIAKVLLQEKSKNQE